MLPWRSTASRSWTEVGQSVQAGPALLNGEFDRFRALRAVLTMLVPYAVSTLSSCEAIRQLDSRPRAQRQPIPVESRNSIGFKSVSRTEKSVNTVGRIQLRGRETRDDIDAVQQMAGEFLKVVHLRNLVDFFDDFVKN